MWGEEAGEGVRPGGWEGRGKAGVVAGYGKGGGFW